MTTPAWPTRLLLLAAFLISGLPARAGELNDEADAILAEHFSGDGPGAAVAVIQDGEVVVETAIGLADIESETAIDSNSVFDLASVSKQFTATAILKLAGDGLLDVRRPVSLYVPDFEVRSPRRAVRVVDLLWHVSGLADYTSDSWDGSDEEFADLTTETHLDWLNESTPNDAPGVSHVYNNSGYVLLALIVERVSAQSFAKFVTSRLFRPAGMTSTRVMDRADKRFRNQVTGYKADDDGEWIESSSPSAVTGDGNVFSCLTDMIAWMVALDGTTILNASQKRTAWARGRLDSGQVIDDDGSSYGYGWVIEDNNRVSHSGSWMGTSTYLLRDNSAGVSVVVLSNDENAEVADIAEALAALVE